MSKIRFLKYLSVFLLPLTAFISFSSQGWLTFLPLVYTFVLIPSLELFFKPDHSNLDKAEQEMVKQEWVYDLLLYMIVPIQLAFVVYFLYSISEPGLTVIELTGKTAGMGIMCGVFGINVAHELGHRTKKFEKFFSKTLLLTSLYMHFFIEHNRGHHKHVATEEDPASARLHESIYAFWLRSVINSYLSAWRLEASRLLAKGVNPLSFYNQMLQFQLIQVLFLGLIFLIFGLAPLLYFMISALVGILLLESVNYIEHYGLSRARVDKGIYERVKPHHSWNSDHVIGRVVLFELSRHSDHHFKASKKYQALEYHPRSPQMPTGYPGMMIVALFPPVWFKLMHPLIGQIERVS
ncbi:MAG: alkane 1-monooxygenase [Cytophagales bacterium]|nr:alkane 1-monooxygenase [Cytophagales bacterium]